LELAVSTNAVEIAHPMRQLSAPDRADGPSRALPPHRLLPAWQHPATDPPNPPHRMSLRHQPSDAFVVRVSVFADRAHSSVSTK